MAIETAEKRVKRIEREQRQHSTLLERGEDLNTITEEGINVFKIVFPFV